jgi:hypothetical protein
MVILVFFIESYHFLLVYGSGPPWTTVVRLSNIKTVDLVHCEPSFSEINFRPILLLENL